MEIERKFLVKLHYIEENLLDKYDHYQVEQTYLSITPEKRIRKITHRNISTFILTKKGEGTLARSEEEKSISKGDYDRMFDYRISTVIRKIRYRIPLYNGLIAELDVFQDDLSGLVLVEVEFDSEENAGNFLIPEWFAQEVTNDKQYKNKNLAKILPGVN